MNQCLMMGEIPKYAMSGDDQRRRVYSIDGLCPTLLTPTGGYFEAKIAIYEQQDDMPEQQS